MHSTFVQEGRRCGSLKRETGSVAEGGSQGTLVSGVAQRYATALFELAEDSGAVDAVAASLNAFNGLIAESEDLRRLIESPAFTAEEQVGAIRAVLAKAGITGIAANFIGLVASKRRLFALPGMITAYKRLAAAAKGIVSAEVTLAEEPTSKRVDEIRAALKGVAGKDVDLHVKVDPALIGGLVVKMGSRMVDASLKTKLNSIRLAMKEVG
jgi:F-type H+-transporting ATPase subunit delta